MSSSSSTAKSPRAPIAPGDNAGYDRFIDQQVERTGAQVKLTDLLSSLMILGAGVLSYLLIVTVLDHWVVSLGVTKFASITTQVSPTSVVLAVGVCAAIGIVFGYYPARRAAALNPIEALRYQ